MSTITPNMNLIVSTIGIDSGLLWETNLNSDLSVIDGHNHSPGSGVQIQPNGININSALSFNNNPATALQAAVLQNQSSLATLNALYAINGELYFNDTSGVVQITLGGAVNATSSGISSGSATASFVSSVLVVNQAANTPANIQAGSILIGNNVAASNFITLSAPSSLSSSYSLILPQLPVATSIMALDTSGNISAPYTVDNSTIAISSNIIQVPAGGITATQLASGAVTNAKLASNSVATANIQNGAVASAKLAALNIVNSTSSGTVSTTSFSYVNIANQSVTITVGTRPIFIGLIGDNSGNFSELSWSSNAANNIVTALYQILRDGTPIQQFKYETWNVPAGGDNYGNPPFGVSLIDLFPSAGSHTYTVQFASGTAGVTVVASNVLTVAYEL